MMEFKLGSIVERGASPPAGTVLSNGVYHVRCTGQPLNAPSATPWVVVREGDGRVDDGKFFFSSKSEGRF
jgi:hypothetical protein